MPKRDDEQARRWRGGPAWVKLSFGFHWVDRYGSWYACQITLIHFNETDKQKWKNIGEGG